ncbi:hypothetical protein [Streptomyces sp. NPDC020965]|uniref:hypothetical protein n=1 Tax=Streptomyces sp. NPDC020965 TaxID=3365105 RepID=UPI003798B9CA
MLSETMDLLSAPAFGRAGLRGRGQRIRFRPGSAEGWVVTRKPEGTRWERGPGNADVVVSGAVADLMLVVSRRVPPNGSQVTVTGDRALLDHWLAHTALSRRSRNPWRAPPDESYSTAHGSRGGPMI